MKIMYGVPVLLAVFGMQALAGNVHVTIVNAAGVDDAIVEAVRAHAEKELYVPVQVRKIEVAKGGDLVSIGKAVVEKKTSEDACFIVLANADTNVALHAKIMTNEQVVVINVTALRSEEPAKNMRRLQRWALRGAAFLFGVGPDFDPHCVMHDYVTLDQLDKMGMNFSPPWMAMVKKAAETRGLDVRSVGPSVPPVPPVPGMGTK